MTATSKPVTYIARMGAVLPFRIAIGFKGLVTIGTLERINSFFIN